MGELAGTFNDMLERLEKLFLRERMFSSAASHELRTPVAVMMAYCEAFLSEALNGGMMPGSIQSLEKMLKETKRMDTIISQLLLLSHGDEGKYKMIPENINVYEIVDAVLQEMREQADNAGIKLKYHGKKDIMVVADQSLLAQLILNLVENAVKYGKRGGRAEVFAEQEAEYTTILVSDNGLGIAGKDLPHIFERFYRADKSRDRSGSGLGLSIAEWIARVHGGEIKVNSEYGSGSVFTVCLRTGLK